MWLLVEEIVLLQPMWIQLVLQMLTMPIPHPQQQEPNPHRQTTLPTTLPTLLKLIHLTNLPL
jgi:hypothetical protein